MLDCPSQIFLTHLFLMVNLFLSSYIHLLKVWLYECWDVSKARTIIFDRIDCCSFVFYPIRRMYIWSSTFKICLTAFAVQQLSRSKDKIATFHRRFQRDLMAKKKWLKKFFDNRTCFIICHGFYVTNFWMRYAFFIVVFRRIAIAIWFLHVRFLEIISNIFQVRFNIGFKYALIHRSTFFYVVYNCCSKIVVPTPTGFY